MMVNYGKIESSSIFKDTESAANQIVELSNRSKTNILIVGAIQTGKTTVCKKITDNFNTYNICDPNEPFIFNVKNTVNNDFAILDETFSYSVDRIAEFLEYTEKNKLRFIFTAMNPTQIDDQKMALINKYPFTLIQVD